MSKSCEETNSCHLQHLPLKVISILPSKKGEISGGICVFVCGCVGRENYGIEMNVTYVLMALPKALTSIFSFQRGNDAMCPGIRGRIRIPE